MKSLGLALGGGGLKGLAHIGVLEIIEDEQIPVSIISGSSAGSIFAALYASGMSAYEMEKLVLNDISPGDYIDYNIGGLLRYLFAFFLPGMTASLDGLIKGNKLEKLIYDLTKGKSLQDSRIPLAIISCDINTARKVVFTNKDIKDTGSVIIRNALLSEAVRSSISIPATFVPRHFHGMQMVDGGIRDIVPVKTQILMGAQYVLAVNLGQETYQEKVSGIIEIVARTLNILSYETSDTAEDMFADMIIYPETGNVRLDEMEKAGQIIRAGRRVMRNKVAELKKELLLQG